MDVVDWYLEGRRQLLAGNENDSVTAFTQALAAGGNPVQLHGCRCAAHLQAGSYTDALADCDQALASGVKDARILFLRGRTCRLLRRYVEAVADLSQAIHIQPTFGMAYLERGLCNLELGATSTAKRDLRNAITFLKLNESEDADFLALFAPHGEGLKVALENQRFRAASPLTHEEIETLCGMLH